MTYKANRHPQAEDCTMQLHHLRLIIRLGFIAFIALLFVSVYATVPQGQLSIALFQTAPLLLAAPLLIQFKSKHLHIVLPVIMIYMCFTAPNLFLSGIEAQLAGVELAMNILLSSFIMWYLLLASKAQRKKNLMNENKEATE